jgi:thioredoxin reductase
VGAIKLVFGTSERGVDIPRVSPFFESTVPGIYIAGELGGMGLIRNAARQGVSVIGHIAGQLASDRSGDADDVVIVGGGPAGLAAALAARQRNLRFRLIEQDAFGGTVVHYPRQKLVMTEEVELPLAGTIPRGHVSKEDLLERFTAIRRRFELPIQESEPVTDLRREGNDFEVVTGRAVYPARKVVLCIGRRGQPRRLGVPGEDLSTVTYRLTDPEQYSGRSVLVVGGGDSAVEAACALAEAAATVSIVHRGQAFSRCKAANRERIAALAEAGRVQVHTGTVPIRFAPGSATVGPAGEETTEAPRALAAEFVIVCAGGDLPATMLSRIGVEVDRHYGEPF